MQIYVGHLPLSYADDDLRALFAPHGTVRRATIGRSKKTGESEGYGFVEMPVKSEARAAIEALRGKKLTEKPLLVRALKPGDDFLQHAMTTHGGTQPGVKTTKPFQGNVGARGAGAIRRGGQRGT
ncbi:MAG: RNA-binding protein [Bacteroidota bacterium]